jgi:hypothetical protein
MKDLILLLKVGNALEEGKSAYEATRGNWVLAKDKVVKEDRIKYVAGLNQNKNMVVGVYKPEMWYQVVKIDEEKIDKKEFGRFRFDGNKAPNGVLENLNKVYDQLLNKFGYGEKAYISISELEDLLSAFTTK